MKKSIIFSIIICTSSLLFGQTENVYWLDHTLNSVKQRKATYKMVVSPQGSTYAVTTFDNNDQVFMKAHSVDAEGQVLDGMVTYYYPTGSIESQGEYLKGKKVGLWQRFTPRGVEKAERVYSLYNAEKEAYIYVDQMPKLNEGVENFEEYLKLSFSHYVNPSVGKGQRLLFSYIINESGYLINPKVIKGGNDAANKELIELLQNMPAWSPGVKQGQKVRVYIEKEIYCN